MRPPTKLLQLVLLPILVSACAHHAAHGVVNGIEYRMTVDRPAIPGGTPYSVDVRVDPDDAQVAELRVDGIAFGRVRSGDVVTVGADAVVRVNGEPRRPTPGRISAGK